MIKGIETGSSDVTRKSKYGNMPPAPDFHAKVRGDAGIYKVWGVDWMHHRVLLERPSLEWTPIDKVTFVDAQDPVDAEGDAS
ncbi:TPA: hypothetical protein ACPWIJ_000413 [Pseudomonas aeruginosa]